MMERIKTAASLRSWLNSCVLGDLRTLVRGIDAYYASDEHLDSEGRPIGGGNFLLVAGCCSAIDYFAYIVNDGSNDDARAIAFINRFLVPINPRYEEVGLLLWRCFRHGTVHRSWPKRIEIEGEADAITTGAGAEESDPHLGPAPTEPVDSFLVNGRRLLADLSRALEGPFGEWIDANGTDDVLRRANPDRLRVGLGDAALRAQIAKVREWNRASRNRPAS